MLVDKLEEFVKEITSDFLPAYIEFSSTSFNLSIPNTCCFLSVMSISSNITNFGVKNTSSFKESLIETFLLLTLKSGEIKTKSNLLVVVLMIYSPWEFVLANFIDVS